MSRRFMSRALVALAVPALVVPALSTPAVAAKGAKVPSVTKVAKIYPYLAGGSADTSTDKVRKIGKDCKQGKPIKGATMTTASYSPADPATPAGTASSPYVFVAAAKFASAKSATSYLTSSSKTTKCTSPGTGDVKVKVKKFTVKLGDQSAGYTAKATYAGQTYVSQSVLVRTGKFFVLVGASTFDGSTPSTKKTISLAKLAVKTAS